jgi:purine nucleosidase
VAILTALASPGELEVLAITAVAGNVPLDLTVTNSLALVELADRVDVPVYRGSVRPMVKDLVTAEYVHGPTGLDGADLPPPRLEPAPGHAVDKLVEILMTSDERVTVCTLGPLTNLGLALVREPDIVDHIAQIVTMGGGFFEGGNTTPAAEFNIYVDPQAAQEVFEVGVPLVMHGLDVTHQALDTPERLEAIRSLGTPLSGAVVGLLEFYNVYDQTRRGRVGAPLHDPCVIAYLVRPELFAGRSCHVAIETRGEHTLGRTVVDWSGRGGATPNALVVNEIDADGFFAIVTERLARLPL